MLIKNKNGQICYTIGHSNHTFANFIKLLQLYDIEYVIDVRSSPFSNYTPQFNKKELENKLNDSNISYLYLGNKVGGRYNDSKLLSKNGIVDYNKVRRTKVFEGGIQKIIELIEKGKIITLMCSEKEPFDCHRFVLVSYSLSRSGIDVIHILENGNIITNNELENKLIKMYGQKTLFDSFNSSKTDDLDNCYEKRNWDIAYSI